MDELEIIFESFKIGAIIIGGLVALYEYRRFRRYGYKAQLDLDFDIFSLGEKDGDYLLDIRPTIKNMGSVRQKFPLIEIWVNTLKDDDINNGTDNKSLRFSEELIFVENIVQNPSDPYFVDPNVEQLFPHQIEIKNPGKFIQVAIRFFYKVSCIRYLYLRLISFSKMSKKWKNSTKINKLKKFRVDQYHIVSKVRQVQKTYIEA